MLLQATWIRPEDLHHYKGLADVVKLATRTHDSPRLVLDAYVRGRFHGNLLDLLEPGYGPLFAPKAIDNDRFPDDWFAQTSQCGGCCETCDFCKQTLARVAVSFAGLHDDDEVTTPLTIGNTPARDGSPSTMRSAHGVLPPPCSLSSSDCD
jgi:hypothetical protein